MRRDLLAKPEFSEKANKSEICIGKEGSGREGGLVGMHGLSWWARARNVFTFHMAECRKKVWHGPRVCVLCGTVDLLETINIANNIDLYRSLFRSACNFIIAWLLAICHWNLIMFEALALFPTFFFAAVCEHLKLHAFGRYTNWNTKLLHQMSQWYSNRARICT